MGNSNILPTIDRTKFFVKYLTNTKELCTKLIYRRDRNYGIISNWGENFKNIKYGVNIQTAEHLAEVSTVDEKCENLVQYKAEEVTDVQSVDFSNIPEIDTMVMKFLKDLYPNDKISHIKLTNTIKLVNQVTLDEIKNPNTNFRIYPRLFIGETLHGVHVYVQLFMVII